MELTNTKNLIDEEGDAQEGTGGSIRDSSATGQIAQEECEVPQGTSGNTRDPSAIGQSAQEVGDASQGTSGNTRDPSAIGQSAQEVRQELTISEMNLNPTVTVERVDACSGYTRKKKNKKGDRKSKRFEKVNVRHALSPPLTGKEESTDVQTTEADQSDTSLDQPKPGPSRAWSETDLQKGQFQIGAGLEKMRLRNDSDDSTTSKKAGVSGAEKRTRGSNTSLASLKRRALCVTTASIDDSSNEEGEMQSARGATEADEEDVITKDEDKDADVLNKYAQQKEDKRGRHMTTRQGTLARNIKERQAKLNKMEKDLKTYQNILKGTYAEEEYSKESTKKKMR